MICKTRVSASSLRVAAVALILCWALVSLSCAWDVRKKGLAGDWVVDPEPSKRVGRGFLTLDKSGTFVMGDFVDGDRVEGASGTWAASEKTLELVVIHSACDKMPEGLEVEFTYRFITSDKLELSDCLGHKEVFEIGR